MTVRLAAWLLACALPSVGALAAERQDSAVLACDGATVTARTLSDDLPGRPVIWLDQTLIVRPAGGGTEVAIPPELRKPGRGTQQLAALVRSWACVQGKTQGYVLLAYGCVNEDRRGVCGGEREWFRVLGRDGSFADAGYRPQDRRYTALYERFGLAAAMRAGVDLTAIAGRAVR